MDDIKDNEIKNSEENDGIDDFVFMREEIKARPINRKKLAKNTLLAAISAVVFGLVACVTFALLAPHVLDLFSDKEETVAEENPILITLPAETPEEEMNPEDMLTIADEEEEEIDYSQYSVLDEAQIKNLLASVKYSITDYQDLYKSLGEIANGVKKSLVRVTSVKTGTDMFNNLYESAGDQCGVIVASTEDELFVLTKYSAVKGYENIMVTFVNSISSKASFVNYDTNTDICVLSVLTSDVNEVTMENISVATLGSSTYSSLVGSPVIAVGSPMGTFDSINYGMATSVSGKLLVTDNLYKRLTTDIYGSQNASGVIVNLKGEIVSIIDTKYSSSDTKNLVGGYGISELKKTIERLVNRKDVVYFGITGTDVPTELISTGAPEGVFVVSVEIDSPAMEAGIQSGDIITGMGANSLHRFSDFVSALKNEEIDKEETITVYRNAQGSYKKLEVEVFFDSYNK